nr:MAG TPA: hypothetical protein [Caudoviricetes sp.]
MRSNLLGYVFKIIISALLIISLCIAIRNDEEKDLLGTYKVVDKKEYIDSSYLFFFLTRCVSKQDIMSFLKISKQKKDLF